MADAVEKGDFLYGISICGSGNGINMTVNKHQGIRSAICWNEEIAMLARSHNDANICALPARFIKKEEALKILEVFLSTGFEGGRHTQRIQKIPLKH
jgi:ribose 5-phosphate isomerase B